MSEAEAEDAATLQANEDVQHHEALQDRVDASELAPTPEPELTSAEELASEQTLSEPTDHDVPQAPVQAIEAVVEEAQTEAVAQADPLDLAESLEQQADAQGQAPAEGLAQSPPHDASAELEEAPQAIEPEVTTEEDTPAQAEPEVSDELSIASDDTPPESASPAVLGVDPEEVALREAQAYQNGLQDGELQVREALQARVDHVGSHPENGKVAGVSACVLRTVASLGHACGRANHAHGIEQFFQDAGATHSSLFGHARAPCPRLGDH
jgi:hypothetical protein